MDRSDSIISVSDSETSLDDDTSVIDDTYSMKYTTANEVIDETITNELPSVKEETDDGQSSPVRTMGPPKLPRQSCTPKRLHQVTLKYYSPEPFALPEIVIVPPSTDRKRVRRSTKTPSKTTRISLANFRRSRIYATPLRTVGEEDKSRGSAAAPVGVEYDKPGGTGDKIISSVLPIANVIEIMKSEKREPIIDDIKLEDTKIKDNNKSVKPTSEKRPANPEVSSARMSRLGIRKPSHLLSPKNSTISKKSPKKEPKYSVQKIKAIIIQSTSSPHPAPSSTKATFTPKETKPGIAKKSNIKEPKVFPKTLCLTPNKSTPNKNFPPTRPVAKVSPFIKAPKVETSTLVSSPLVIRGVRLNRRFELLMQHRNNVNAKK